MSFKERLGRAIMRADSQDLAVIEELCKQRFELLEALRMVQEAAFDMRGEDFNLTTEQWSAFHAAITKAGAVE